MVLQQSVGWASSKAVVGVWLDRGERRAKDHSGYTLEQEQSVLVFLAKIDLALYVDEAASELIKANLEPTLEQYKPMVLSYLSFFKFTLGTVAPQFTGVSTVEDRGEEITVELEMNWDGNPSIILDIKTRLGVGLSVQVKNIAFIRVSRLIFK
ncbi:unnamed protein product [Lactuca virosa]|uniref:SMP-LTD domain-containing protein n=1 Tax=Lactuca virosa TaxID=75947 RepID=A0AAU9MHN9_9ASTR|nr:unnamed protein product [Lactuca virosa]